MKVYNVTIFEKTKTTMIQVQLSCSKHSKNKFKAKTLSTNTFVASLIDFFDDKLKIVNLKTVII